MKNKSEHPNLDKLGIKVYQNENNIPFVKWDEVHTSLLKHGIDEKKFSEYYGCQTQGMEGPCFYDVEAVLERLINKRLTGTQLLWD